MRGTMQPRAAKRVGAWKSPDTSPCTGVGAAFLEAVDPEWRETANAIVAMTPGLLRRGKKCEFFENGPNNCFPAASHPAPWHPCTRQAGNPTTRYPPPGSAVRERAVQREGAPKSRFLFVLSSGCFPRCVPILGLPRGCFPLLWPSWGLLVASRWCQKNADHPKCQNSEDGC